MNSKKILVGEMAENLIGSEIIKLGGEINDRIRKGEKIFNYTIGDFDPKIFPIPTELTQAIVDAYHAGHTNYPAANGILELRKEVSAFLMKYEDLTYFPDEILITGGARPGIYATYLTIVDKGDKVVYPLPSWNNNHYCHLVGANGIGVETKAENNFMPTAAELKPHIKDAVLLSLCSPLNPTGTTFSREQLEEICDMVIEENKNRNENQKPLYLLYDQIYWVLTFGETEHYSPVTIHPGMRDYTIFVDGMSKAFGATGIRVGWTFGPMEIIDKMKSILSHIGAWSPKAEQVACAAYLMNHDAVKKFLEDFKKNIYTRLQNIYDGFMQLKQKGFAVDCLMPQAAIYLAIQFKLKGKIKSDGKVLEKTEDVTAYILEQTGIAVVPFYAFGSSTESDWYRLSVGTCRMEDIPNAMERLELALGKLK